MKTRCRPDCAGSIVRSPACGASSECSMETALSMPDQASRWSFRLAIPASCCRMRRTLSSRSDPQFASTDHSDRHPVTVEFMIFVVSALTSAKVREIVNELDCCDPFHHFEPELIFAAQP